MTRPNISIRRVKEFGGSNAPLRDTVHGILVAIAKTIFEDPIGEYDEHHMRHWERFGLNETKPKSKKKGKTTEKQFRAKYENKTLQLAH